MNNRLEIASRILGGFACNPAVFGHNPKCGWSLVNCTEQDVAAYAVRLADELIAAEAAIKPKEKTEGLLGRCEITEEERRVLGDDAKDWRLLRAGEEVRELDEIAYEGDKDWELTISPGYIVRGYAHDELHYRRRRHEQPAKAGDGEGSR